LRVLSHIHGAREAPTNTDIGYSDAIDLFAAMWVDSNDDAPSAVPEPPSLALALAGLIVLGVALHRRCGQGSPGEDADHSSRRPRTAHPFGRNRVARLANQMRSPASAEGIVLHEVVERLDWTAMTH
jgi:hypothetical protein